MTEREQVEIQEIANIIFQKANGVNFDDVSDAAVALYKEGYRRQTKAKWKYTETLPMRGPVYQCTNCKEEYNRQALSMKRCPDCGAIMEGEE